MSKGRLLVAAPIALIAMTAALAAACGSTGNVQDLELQDISSGYFDEGVVNGENKIVPTITFKLRNKGTAPVSTVQTNTIFQAEGADGPMDEVLTRAVGTDGVTPQQSTASITVRSTIGYTSQQPRAEMLKNSQFRDVRVKVFGKSGSGSWTLLGESVVDRRILTQ
ncbi:MAG: hypothetical protein WD690_19500 [Vicinamibacterales bacterium]